MKILAIFFLSILFFGCSDTGDLVLVGYKIDTTDRSYDRNGKVVGAKRNIYMTYKSVKP